ncbi:hypothetical protein EK21DRAFT_18112, partial [Setomelanomma holmii]
MNPTFALQIPFTLLGRKDAIDPDELWSPEDRYTRPVQIVCEALRRVRADLPVYVGSEKDERKQSAGWLLLPLSASHQDQLSVAETVSAGENVWSCTMQLQRSNIALSTRAGEWRHFKIEAENILEALKETFLDFTGPIPGTKDAVRWWSLVTGEKDWLRLSLVPPPASDHIPGALDTKLVKKILITVAAVERELTLLTVPSALLEYWSLSRFLEFRAIRQLRHEKDLMWKRLVDDTQLMNKRKAMMYQRDQEKWLSEFDDEDTACQRTKGRRKEWFDVVN